MQQGITTRSTQDLVAPLSQILQVTHGTQRTDYVSGHERLLALDGMAQTWYGSDGLGSVRQTLDATGAPLSALHYDPWGLPPGNATPPTFGFTGELQDGMSGLVYLRARWYGPQHGRFLSRDPFAGFPMLPYSQHPYQYAYANPVLVLDPSGEVCVPTWVPAIGGWGCQQGVTARWSSSEETAFVAAYPEINAAMLQRLPGYQRYSAQEALALGRAYQQFQAAPLQYSYESEVYGAAALFSEYFLRQGLPHTHPSELEAQFACLQDKVIKGTASGGEEWTFLKLGIILGLNSYAGQDRLYAPVDRDGGGYPRDYPSKQTKKWSADFNSEAEARAFAREKLGSNPIEVSPGKWRSRDGKWQYRAKPGDVEENHLHLEELNPKTGEVVQNLHLRWPKGKGR